MRHVKFFSLKDVDSKKVVKLLKMIKSKKGTCDKIKSWRG